MTPEDKIMIPLSVVDAKIKELKELGEGGSINTGRSCSFAVHVLEQIKKEAISFPIFSIMEPLEQRIRERIAELEIDNNYCHECGIDYQNFARDELRKLLQ